ncbi:CZB domain-containing protein [Pseudoalteromonas sp. H105]|uniref:CZB domain-containing protein n=1 Tax=Pseudoalteromonas sp. H105 TaxID=1348393 RepID=UPI0039DFE2E0
MKNTIATAAIRSFVQTVKLDHIVWKGEVYAVANGSLNKSIDDFSDHTMCRLGKWYNSEQAQTFKQMNVFKQLEEPHKEVHRNGVEALVLIHSGEKANAIKHINLMEAASQRVMNLLDDLANQ